MSSGFETAVCSSTVPAMNNTGKLAGRTLFITGASRGIGLSIALKAAKDGANVVIAAKTAETNAKLPGTIYSAAEEIVKAGGKCLPCVVDVRNENEVQSAVEAAVKQFGGIDILVNNASAISLTGTLDTPMKRYDLMHNVNTRGTFLVSQKCIPYLKQSKNPHILNISPPLVMKPIWFQNHVAYTMAKYGMSMCVLGMAEELKPHNIAVNALWPRTAIYTAAMKMLGGGDEIADQCRTPEIMADSAYIVLTRDSRNYTGQFYIDEKVLKEVGVTDFSRYAVKPGHPLMLDFFLEEADAEQVYAGQKSVGVEKKAEKSSGDKPAPASANGPVGGIFKTLEKVIGKDLVGRINGVYLFNLTGSEPGRYFIDLKSGDGSCGSGDPPGGKADVTFTLDSGDLVKMFKGELKATAAFMGGKLKIKGDMGLAMKLERLMGEVKSKL